MSPIEDLAAWKIHRAAADAVRDRGGHWSCSQSIGFAEAHRDVKPMDAGLGKPCAQCLGIWEAAKKEQQEGRAA